jgi:hypothetical protein
MKLFRMLWLGILFIAFASVLPRAGQETPLTATEKALADQINKIRTDNGLAAAEISTSLTHVARAHVGDLNGNHPDTGEDARGEDCNLHSWSNRGSWTAVCYTDDHEYQTLMWSKPHELTAYTSNGYEIASFYSGGMTPETAVASWKGSPDHLEVIVNSGIWAPHPWKAMGVGISGNYACVWFGELTDPAGPLAAATGTPTTVQDYPDVHAFAGGLALSVTDATIAGTEPLKLVLGLNGRDTADLANCRYVIQQKTAGGGWRFIFHSHRGFFEDLIMTPGEIKKWHWTRKVDAGQPVPVPGKYRLKFKAPRFTSDIIFREFEILR